MIMSEKVGTVVGLPVRAVSSVVDNHNWTYLGPRCRQMWRPGC